MIPLLRGPTLDYLLDRQAWAWLYAVNIYIANQGDWSFSYIEHFWSLAVEEHFYLFWPLVVFLVARRPRTLMALSLTIALCAVLARLIGLLAGLSWWTTYVLTPFRLDGLALGAFLAVTARQPWGSEFLMRVLPRVLAVAGGLLAVTFIFPGPALTEGVPLAALIRSASIQVLLACLLVWAIIARERSAAKLFLCSRLMVFLGTYSYGLYVYHHFIFYYLSTNHTELELARWLGSHALAVAFQATAGIAASLMIAYLSYELFEKRFLELKRFFDTPKQRTARAVGSRPAVPAVERKVVEVRQLSGDSSQRGTRMLDSFPARPGTVTKTSRFTKMASHWGTGERQLRWLPILKFLILTSASPGPLVGSLMLIYPRKNSEPLDLLQRSESVRPTVRCMN